MQVSNVRGFWVKLRNPYTGETEEIRQTDWNRYQKAMRQDKAEKMLGNMIKEYIT